MQDLNVADLMSKDVHHVSPKLPVLELERELAAHRISGAPVLDRSGHVVGIVSRSDIDRVLARERSTAAAVGSYYLDPTDAPGDTADPTSAALERLRSMHVEDIMTQEVIAVSPGATLGEAAQVMASRHIHRLLVLEGSSLVGLLSSLDIVRAVAESS